jgi:F-box-like
MPTEIPVDVLLNILEYVDKADLATMCRVSKICCSCSQDFLYRDIDVKTRKAPGLEQTLAKSTHLARKVHSFDARYSDPDLAMAFRNMTSLRILKLSSLFHMDILDGCTFKLDSFECNCVHNHNGSYQKFLSNQPSLKNVTFPVNFDPKLLDATCLPNLTRISAMFYLLPNLIPGRALNEVISYGYTEKDDSIDLGVLALSTTPIQKLTIDYSSLYPTPVHLLASFLPSLTHFTLTVSSCPTVFKDEVVCELPFY